MIKAPEIVHRLKYKKKGTEVNNEEVIDIPMPITEPKEQVLGNFPALANKLQDELGSYLTRQRNAVNKILDVTREKTEFIEIMAEKTEEDLKNEKRNISRSLGNV